MNRLDIFTPAFWIRFWTNITENALHSGLQLLGLILFYLLLRTLANRLIDGIINRLLGYESHLGLTPERSRRLQTLRSLCRSVVGYLLFFIFGIMLLQVVGFPTTSILTTAGVAGLAIGFGGQKLVKDVISGFFLVIDNSYAVGETVTIGGLTGQVEEMGIRITRLRDAMGRLYMLANGDIGTVTNLSRYPVKDFIEVNVAPTADMSKTVATIEAAGKALYESPEHHLKAAPDVLGMTAFSATSVTVRVGVVSDPQRLQQEQMRVRAAVRDALLAAEIPLA